MDAPCNSTRNMEAVCTTVVTAGEEATEDTDRPTTTEDAGNVDVVRYCWYCGGAKRSKLFFMLLSGGDRADKYICEFPSRFVQIDEMGYSKKNETSLCEGKKKICVLQKKVNNDRL